MSNQHKNAVRKLFDRVRGQDRGSSRSQALDTIEIDELNGKPSDNGGRQETEILRARIAEKINQFEKEKKGSK